MVRRYFSEMTDKQKGEKKMATKKKATKKSTKAQAAKKTTKTAPLGLKGLEATAEEIAALEKMLKVVKQKSNLAIMHDKLKVLVLFGSRTKLKIRSKFFESKEKDVTNRTLTLKKPTDSQILSTSRVLVQRALSDKKGGK